MQRQASLLSLVATQVSAHFCYAAPRFRSFCPHPTGLGRSLKFGNDVTLLESRRPAQRSNSVANGCYVCKVRLPNTDSLLGHGVNRALIDSGMSVRLTFWLESKHSILTSPSFCTTTNERVYITTSSDNDAKGGSQGAVGDRRAALCGANATGAGGL